MRVFLEKDDFGATTHYILYTRAREEGGKKGEEGGGRGTLRRTARHSKHREREGRKGGREEGRKGGREEKARGEGQKGDLFLCCRDFPLTYSLIPYP